MKGLLIKDFKLIKMHRNYFAMIIAIAFVISLLTEDTTFMLGFISFITSMFTISTISYDEFDNGNAFLFTLPIDRKKYAAENYEQRDIYFLGRGVDYAVALEGSLKLKEISYIHCDAYAGGELKHGPIALIDKGTAVITLLTQEALKDKMVSNVREVSTRGGNIFAIANQGDEIAKTVAEEVVYIPKTVDLLTPLVSVVPLQLLS